MLLLNDFFGAPPIRMEDIDELKRNSPEIIVYAVPAIILFTVLEMIAARRERRKVYDTAETMGSLLTGIGNLFISLLLKAVLIYWGVLIYNMLPWRMAFSWWTLLPCLIIFDFCSYWSHRISHFVRFFWATHVVHHSSEHYNLSVSFRQSWIQHLKIIFFLPVALVGFHPVIFFVANQIAILFQFWQHTEYIRKLHPIIEYLFVTPSNHRVHHGSDEKYLDKNFGVIFAVWDRWLGTFQPEEEKPTYGITTKITQKVNPLYLNFHELRDIWRDMKNAKSFRKKMYYLFGSPAKIAREKKEMNQDIALKESEDGWQGRG
jgi:sterol desaturase/sphingolipid hydroxylase (fatty acid hydroxylase superfamily)